MKPVLAILFFTLPCLSLAQKSTPVGVGGFGNVLHPGTGSPSSYFGAGVSNRSGRRAPVSNGVIGYPLYVGGTYVPAYGSSAYTSGYAPDYSSQTQLNPQQQYAPAPPVVINQYFAPPVPPEPVTGFYQPSSGLRPRADDDNAEPAESKYYLLAFKDHSVYSALAYWVEDKTLHYVTPQNTHNQASLDLVDLEFTKQLNQNRTVPFSIDTPSK